jgi:hypothetical protein
VGSRGSGFNGTAARTTVQGAARWFPDVQSGVGVGVVNGSGGRAKLPRGSDDGNGDGEGDGDGDGVDDENGGPPRWSSRRKGAETSERRLENRRRGPLAIK